MPILRRLKTNRHTLGIWLFTPSSLRSVLGFSIINQYILSYIQSRYGTQMWTQYFQILNYILYFIFYKRSKDTHYLHGNTVRITFRKKLYFYYCLFIEFIHVTAPFIPASRCQYLLSLSRIPVWSFSISKEF